MRVGGRVGLVLAVLLGLGGDASAAAASGPFEGILSIVWGDPHPTLGSGGATRYTLTLPDGNRVALLMGAKEGLASKYLGQRVVVSGRVVPSPRSPFGILVDGLAPAVATQGRPAAVVGTRRVVYLLLRFAGDPSVPHPPSFYSNLNNPDTPPPGEPSPATVNGFFRKTSWNQFSWTGDVGGAGGVPATDWLTLPFPKSHYANCGWADVCADLDALATDGMTMGTAAGIDFSRYDNVNLVLSNDLDCCAWGGGLVYQNRFFGATWEPPWGQETGIYAHEMGHSLGLPHSGWAYWAYDSPWDVMSGGAAATSVLCGSYASANTNNGVASDLYCTEPGGGYIAPHKDYLGWIPAANEVVIDTSVGAATVTLEAGALPLGPAAKMIKICAAGWPCSGPGARYLTVEARVKGLGGPSQFDNGLPGDGVIIHSFQEDRPAIGIGDPCFFNSSSGWAVPVDATLGDWIGAPTCSAAGRSWPDYALGNAQWLPGQFYADPASGRTIQVLSRTGSSFVIAVSEVHRNRFFSLTPCRVVDTRAAAAPLGGPSLPPLGNRTFALTAGPCGIPGGTTAVSANITVVEPAAAGHLTLYPGNGTLPGASSINFLAGQTRANNLVLQLDPSGAITVLNGATGSVHFILDVNGYFQ